MDNTQIDNLNKALNNSYLFFNLVSKYQNDLKNGVELNEKDKEQLISHLMLNNKMNKNIIDIFNDKKENTEINKVRKLNEQIRELEMKVGEGTTPFSIAGYILTLNQDIKEELKKEGLDVIVSTNFSTCLSIDIKYIKSFLPFKESSISIVRNDKEKESEIKKSEELCLKSKNSNFNFNDEGYLCFSDSNIELLNSKIRDKLSFLGDITDIKYDINTVMMKKKYNISSVGVKIILLESDKNLAELFKN